MLRPRLSTRPLPRCPLLSMRGWHSSQPVLDHWFAGPEREFSCFSGGENDLDDGVSECVLSGSDLDDDVSECVVAGMSPSSGMTGKDSEGTLGKLKPLKVALDCEKTLHCVPQATLNGVSSSIMASRGRMSRKTSAQGSLGTPHR